MAILAYSLSLLSIFYMIYNFKKNGKDAFILTPYKIDIAKLDQQKEKTVVRILIIQYTQIAMALLTTMILEILAKVNAWDRNISSALVVILVSVTLVQIFIVQKRIKNILG